MVLVYVVVSMPLAEVRAFVLVIFPTLGLLLLESLLVSLLPVFVLRVIEYIVEKVGVGVQGWSFLLGAYPPDSVVELEDLLPEFVNESLRFLDILGSTTGLRESFLEVLDLLLEEYKVRPRRFVGVVAYLLSSVLVLGQRKTLSVCRTLDGR